MNAAATSAADAQIWLENKKETRRKRELTREVNKKGRNADGEGGLSTGDDADDEGG